MLDTCGFKGSDQYTRWLQDIQYETGKRGNLAHGKVQKLPVCIKRTDKTLFTEGRTTHLIAALELLQAGDINFLRASVVAVRRLILAQ